MAERKAASVNLTSIERAMAYPTSALQSAEQNFSRYFRF
jgi:hypothetical protein